jgi:hypothetical protein
VQLPHYGNWNDQNNEIISPVEGADSDEGTDTISTCAIDGTVVDCAEGPANKEDLQYISDGPENHKHYTYLCSLTDFFMDRKQSEVEKEDAQLHQEARNGEE